ncbi:MAG TPA: A24 family peptidase [Bryobacteraceae bacterium]|jgi:prepilin peptidase CpaA
MTFLLQLPLPVACCLAAMAITAGVYDLSTRRIPNWLTVSGAGAGIGLNLLLYGAAGLRMALFGLATGFGVYLVLYLLRAMGAGDVKLMAAVGAFLGPSQWFAIFVVTSILGAAAGAILALRNGRLSLTLSNVRYIAAELLHARAPYINRPQLDLGNEKALTLPHGAVIAAATMLALVFTIHSY